MQFPVSSTGWASLIKNESYFKTSAFEVATFTLLFDCEQKIFPFSQFSLQLNCCKFNKCYIWLYTHILYFSNSILIWHKVWSWNVFIVKVFSDSDFLGFYILLSVFIANCSILMLVADLLCRLFSELLWLFISKSKPKMLCI